MMNVFNPIPYMTFPFVFLWKVLRESNTKRGRIATSIVSLLLIIGGLNLLFSWYKVPTKKHFISFERIYTKDVADNCYFVADYYLRPATGGFYEDPFKYKESVRPYWLYYKKGNTFPRIVGKNSISKISDLVAGDIGQELQKECDKRNLSFDDFDYGFLLTHMYDDYTYEMGNDYSFVCSVDTVVDGSRLSSISMLKSNPNVMGLEILHKKYYGNRIMSFDCSQYSRQYTGLLFTNKFISQPLGRDIFSHSGFGLLNKLYKFLSLHDITKANYNISFYQEGLDSVDFMIKFKEGVAFSEMNIQPTKKDMNSISFGITSEKRFSYFNINFYVEFLEANNIQMIRTGLLMALLALPIGLLMRNIWALLTQTTPPSSPSNTSFNQPTANMTEEKREEKS